MAQNVINKQAGIYSLFTSSGWHNSPVCHRLAIRPANGSFSRAWYIPDGALP